MTVTRPTYARQTNDHRHGSGSQQALRARNLQTLASDLHDNGPATQRELAERTGLSQATVSNLVKILVEEHKAITQPTVSSGRRATLVTASST